MIRIIASMYPEIGLIMTIQDYLNDMIISASAIYKFIVSNWSNVSIIIGIPGALWYIHQLWTRRPIVKIEGITNDVLPGMRPISKAVDYKGWVAVNVKNDGRTVGKCTGSIKTDKGEWPIIDWVSYDEAFSKHQANDAERFKFFDLEGGGRTKYLYADIKFASIDSVIVSIKSGKKEWTKNFT